MPRLRGACYGLLTLLTTRSCAYSRTTDWGEDKDPPKPKKNKSKKVIGAAGKLWVVTNETGDDEAPHFDNMLESRPIVAINFIIDCLPVAEPGMTEGTLQQCRDSRPLKPILTKLSKRNKAFAFASVDIEAEEYLAEKFGVTVAPTLMLFQNGSTPIKYGGEHTQEAISDWLAGTSRLSHARSQAEVDVARKARPKDTVLVVVSGMPQAGHYLAEAVALFRTMGDSHTDINYFYLIDEKAESFRVEIYRGAAEKTELESKVGQEYYSEHFVEFITKEKTPWFGVMSAENAWRVIDSKPKGIIGVCFVPNEVEVKAEKYSGLFKKVAMRWKQYRFVYIDASRGELPAAAPACPEGERPSIVVKEAAQAGKPAREEHAAFKEAELTEKNVHAFLKRVIKGKGLSAKEEEYLSAKEVEEEL